MTLVQDKLRRIKLLLEMFNLLLINRGKRIVLQVVFILNLACTSLEFFISHFITKVITFKLEVQGMTGD